MIHISRIEDGTSISQEELDKLDSIILSFDNRVDKEGFLELMRLYPSMCSDCVDLQEHRDLHDLRFKKSSEDSEEMKILKELKSKLQILIDERWEK